MLFARHFVLRCDNEALLSPPFHESALNRQMRLIRIHNPNSTEEYGFRPVFFMMPLAFPGTGTTEMR